MFSIFTSTSLFVQQLVASGTLALEAYWSVHADVRAASVVHHALIQPWETKRGSVFVLQVIWWVYNHKRFETKLVMFREGAWTQHVWHSARVIIMIFVILSLFNHSWIIIRCSSSSRTRSKFLHWDPGPSAGIWNMCVEGINVLYRDSELSHKDLSRVTEGV